MRIKPPALLVSTHVKTPCLIGLLRPAILLPEADIARRSSSTHDVIVHELAHLARRDCLWNLLGRMASAVFFFQPLVWPLVRQLEHTSERVVDDFVVYQGAKPSDYARMLVEVAKRCQPVPSVLTASTGVSQFNSFLGRRVQRILDTGRSLSVRAEARAVAAIIAAGIVGTIALGLVGPADAVSRACPTDLGWLRSEVGNGALVHHADGRIYLTELSSGESVHVGNGNQPEFSPDGSKFAWIDGRTAKGRMRKGDTSIHVIAENVRASGGIHWVSNTELALVIGSKWFRVRLVSGGMGARQIRNPANGHLYEMLPAGKWADLIQTALALGGQLVTINNEAENRWIVDNFGEGTYWIGMTDNETYSTEGKWVWLNGEHVTYENWARGEPNDYSGEDGATMTAGGKWNDSTIRSGTGDSKLPGLVEVESGAAKGEGEKVKTSWRQEIPELTALGLGGYECDVKLGDDGVWSYVAKVAWRTSNGRRGRVAGSCSVSLSPDGRSVTSLHRDHKTASVQAIRPGGTKRTLRWEYGGGFDNHRWASNNADYIVVVDEIDQKKWFGGVTYPVVMRADGSRHTRMGNKGFAKHGVYGDFVVGDGVGKSWSEGVNTAQAVSSRNGRAMPVRETKTTPDAKTTHDSLPAESGRVALKISGMRQGERAVIRVLPGDQRQHKVDEKTIAELRKRALFTKEISSDVSIAIPGLPEGTYTVYAGAFNGRSRSVRGALRSLRYTFDPVEIAQSKTTDVTVLLPGFGRATIWVSGLRRGEEATVLVLAGDQRQDKPDEKAIVRIAELALFKKEIHSNTSIAVPELPKGTYTVIAGAYDGRAQSERDALRSLRYTLELIEILDNGTTDVPVLLKNAETVTQG